MKRALAFMLVITLIAAVCIVPTSVFAAESYHGMTFNPPANYWNGYDSDYDEYNYYAEDDDYTEVAVYMSDSDDDTITSVKQWSEYEWSNWILEWCDGQASDISVSFENIAGYDFVKIDYTENVDGDPWYCTFYNGGPDAQYCLYYTTLFAFMPYYDEFLNMVHSVSFGGGSAPVNDGIKIYVNGEQVFPDAAPFLMNDRTMVPIRVIAEKLGYTVSWDDPNQCVTMSKGNFDVQVMIDSTWITKYIDGQVAEYGFMDVVPCLRNDRTFIPLRAAAEAMGCAVDWDDYTQSVFITSGGQG